MSTAQQLSNRERIFTTINGGPVDRYPVWLKMVGDSWMSRQPESVRTLGQVELLEAAGCDLVLGCNCSADPVSPHVTCTLHDDGVDKTRVWTTPDGELTSVITWDADSRSGHPTKMPVTTPEQLRIYRWLHTDVKWTVNAERAAEHHAQQAEFEAIDAVTFARIGPGPLMAMFEEVCGPENAVFLMYDEPELFRETLDLMHQNRMKQLRALLPALRSDTFWLTENTSTSLISPSLFSEFCVPHLHAYGHLVREHDIIAVHHMCGTLDALLEMIDPLPAQVNEAFTTSPLGDTSLAGGRTRMPSKCLMGGTNATLWMSDVDTIVQTVAEDLANCPDRRKIFLTSGGALPPVADLEKVKAVVERFKNLPI